MSPGQQLLQTAQLPFLLLTVQLLLLPLLLQRSDLSFVAADRVWRGRKGRGKEGQCVQATAASRAAPSLRHSAR